MYRQSSFIVGAFQHRCTAALHPRSHWPLTRRRFPAFPHMSTLRRSTRKTAKSSGSLHPLSLSSSSSYDNQPITLTTNHNQPNRKSALASPLCGARACSAPPEGLCGCGASYRDGVQRFGEVCTAVKRGLEEAHYPRSVSFVALSSLSGLESLCACWAGGLMAWALPD